MSSQPPRRGPQQAASGIGLAAQELSLDVEEVLCRLDALLHEPELGWCGPYLAQAALELRNAATHLDQAASEGCENLLGNKGGLG